jgi:hypothetical protein
MTGIHSYGLFVVVIDVPCSSVTRLANYIRRDFFIDPG